VDASLRWLASQTNPNWLLLFDNADNVDLKLKKFFPSFLLQHATESFAITLRKMRTRMLKEWIPKMQKNCFWFKLGRKVMSEILH